MKQQDTYFDMQVEALNAAFRYAEDKGYTVIFPENIWTEHVNYGTSQRYSLELDKAGKRQRKMLHISLYRMETGRYESTYYIN